MAEQKAPSALAGMTSNAEECRQVYDTWASNYEKDTKAWGYDMPTKVAALLAKHSSTHTNETPHNIRILDAGAGDGLSGVDLRQHFVSSQIVGADLSSEMLKIAEKRGCYNSLKRLNLNLIPFPFEDGAFDAIACVGTMTYVNPTSLQELCRVVKPGGWICYTNRTDKLENFQREESRLETEGYWTLIEKQGPLPYLPNHPDFADKIEVVIYLYQTRK